MEKKEIKNENKKELITGIIIGVILITIILASFIIPIIKSSNTEKPKEEEKVSKKFVDEYPEVGKDNVF